MKVKHVLVLCALAACGGGPGTGPVDDNTAQDVCADSCAHDAECDPLVDVDACTTSCVDDIVGWARADVVEDVFACQTALACDATDDTCFEDNCAPTSAHDAYETRCRERAAECQLSTGDTDQLCETDPSQGTGDNGFFCAITPSIMDDLTACFDEASCDTVLTCLQGVLQDNGIDF